MNAKNLAPRETLYTPMAPIERQSPTQILQVATMRRELHFFWMETNRVCKN